MIDDILYIVGSFLDQWELGSFECVCRKWNELNINKPRADTTRDRIKLRQMYHLGREDFVDFIRYMMILEYMDMLYYTSRFYDFSVHKLISPRNITWSSFVDELAEGDYWDYLPQMNMGPRKVSHHYKIRHYEDSVVQHVRAYHTCNICDYYMALRYGNRSFNLESQKLSDVVAIKPPSVHALSTLTRHGDENLTVPALDRYHIEIGTKGYVPISQEYITRSKDPDILKLVTVSTPNLEYLPSNMISLLGNHNTLYDIVGSKDPYLDGETALRSLLPMLEMRYVNLIVRSFWVIDILREHDAKHGTNWMYYVVATKKDIAEYAAKFMKPRILFHANDFYAKINVALLKAGKLFMTANEYKYLVNPLLEYLVVNKEDILNS